MGRIRDLTTSPRRWSAVAVAALSAGGLLASTAAPVEPAVAPAPTTATATTQVATVATASEPTTPEATTRWVGTWATAAAMPVGGQALAGFTDTTLRQRIHTSVGGDQVRLRLTNLYGTAPLVVQAATLALPGSRPGDIDESSLVPVTFSGESSVTIPTGTELVSDPVVISVPDDGDVLVSLYVPGPTGPATYHGAAHSTGWIGSGDRTSAATAESLPGRTTSFWFLDGLDVRTKVDGAVAFLGDSITDGDRTTLDADHRWPDFLADRMLDGPRPHRFGVLNAGIGGNRMLLDARSGVQGVNALARLERDVLTQTAVHTVVLFEGVNDIQNTPTQYDPSRITAAYEQVIQRAHDSGLTVVGATIGPFRGWSSWTPEREAVRIAVNEWIRTSGAFDAVIDFDAVLRDPEQPDRILAAYDSGDHLHPGDVGYKAMADAVDLDLLVP